jgi:hypothetical protein
MDIPERISVSSLVLDELVQAVERVSFLNRDSHRSYLLDPCCMLEALADVYVASLHLVQENGQCGAELASGAAT